MGRANIDVVHAGIKAGCSWRRAFEYSIRQPHRASVSAAFRQWRRRARCPRAAQAAFL